MGRRPVPGLVLMFLVLALGVAPGWTHVGLAQESPWAPLDQPGPPLEASASELDAAFYCYDDLERLDATGSDPVLFVPGTTLTGDDNYGWNWIPALRNLGIPVCAVDLYRDGMGDLQRSVEHVVHAVRAMRAASGRHVRMVGYSQGGLLTRFALRFWPDLRLATSEVVTLGGVHNGTEVLNTMCAPGCAEGLHQMKPDAALVAAINSRATVFDGVDVTSIYSRHDEFATPADGTSSIVEGATNIALQDVCPLNVAEHLVLGTIDPVAYALGVDALTHAGPANPDRIDDGVCLQAAIPGMDPVDAAEGLARFTTDIASRLALAPMVDEGPPLRCYLTASCSDRAATDPVARSTPPRPDETNTPVVTSTTGLLPSTGSTHPITFVVGTVILGLATRHLATYLRTG